MNEEEARTETIKLFGEDSFTEFDDNGPGRRYYVGACPTSPGPYQGFMGYRWEEALMYAKSFIREGFK